MKLYLSVLISVTDPELFDADPDPTFILICKIFVQYSTVYQLLNEPFEENKRKEEEYQKQVKHFKLCRTKHFLSF